MPRLETVGAQALSLAVLFLALSVVSVSFGRLYAAFAFTLARRPIIAPAIVEGEDMPCTHIARHVFYFPVGILVVMLVKRRDEVRPC